MQVIIFSPLPQKIFVEFFHCSHMMTKLKLNVYRAEDEFITMQRLQWRKEEEENKKERKKVTTMMMTTSGQTFYMTRDCVVSGNIMRTILFIIRLSEDYIFSITLS